jgi:hypothetical protein
MTLSGDVTRVDADRRVRRGARWSLLFGRTSSLHLANDVSNFGIVDLQDIHLPDERVFNLARQFEPLLTRPRA